MSIDVNQPGSTMPAAPPKKGGGMKWVIIGGLGCLGVVGICAAGAVWVFNMGLNVVKTNPEYLTAVATVESSQQVKDLIGTPVSVGEAGFPVGDPNQPGVISLTAPITGPDGSGTMTWSGRQEGQNFETTDLVVTINGEEIDLTDDGNDFLDLDIDDGS